MAETPAGRVGGGAAPEGSSGRWPVLLAPAVRRGPVVLGQAYCLLPIPHAVVYVRLRCVMDPVMAALAHGFGGHMVASLCCTSPPTPGDKIILGMCRIVCQIGHPSHTHFHSRSRRSHAHQIFFQHLLLRTCYNHVTAPTVLPAQLSARHADEPSPSHSSTSATP